MPNHDQTKEKTKQTIIMFGETTKLLEFVCFTFSRQEIMGACQMMIMIMSILPCLGRLIKLAENRTNYTFNVLYIIIWLKKVFPILYFTCTSLGKPVSCPGIIGR